MLTTQNMLHVPKLSFYMKINMFVATAFFLVELFLHAHFLCTLLML